MRFFKYHALGNDYLVLQPADFPQWSAPAPAQVRAICHRHFGIGSDGILWGPLPARDGAFGLRIFNPDGSEAEKSGNGTRIFSRFLWDRKLAGDAFAIETPGGLLRSKIKDRGRLITMDMGSVSFDSSKIPVSGPHREVVNEKISVQGRDFTFCAATIGNPHCVLPLPEITAEMAKRYGPEIETHAHFPRRTNVQFLQVLDRAHTPDQPDWHILSAQGAVLDQMGRHPDAQRYYLTALKIAPDEPSVLSNLGLSYALSKNLREAEATLRRAAAQHPVDARVRQNLALVVGLQGRFAEAEQIAGADLPPDQAAANVAYLRQMLTHKGNSALTDQTAHFEQGSS